MRRSRFLATMLVIAMLASMVLTTGITAYGATGQGESEVGGMAFARKTAEAVTVDGRLDEAFWNLSSRVEKATLGTPDNQVSFDARWDDNNLYVAVQVLDSVLINDSGTDTWNDDSVEIFIDGLNNRSKTYQEDDNQIFIGYGDPSFETYHGSAGIASGVQDVEGGYTVELSIAWSAIGVVPREGIKIGFDIANDDDDDIGQDGDRDGILVWHGDNNNWQDTSNFGELFLTGDKNPAVANAAEISVDGSIDESVWNLDNTVEKLAEGTGHNNTVTFDTACDETYLYVAVEVLDEALLADSSNEFWNDDSVEIFVDGGNQKSSSYDADDRQFVFRYGDTAVFGSAHKYGVRHAFADVEGGYTLEVAIPWVNLGIDPVHGAILGFDVANNDDDDGGARESAAVWYGTGNNWADPSGFGYLILNNPGLQVQSYTGDRAVLEDPANDYGRLYAQDGDVAVQDGAFVNGSTAEACSITYKSPSGDILAFGADVLSAETGNIPVRVFLSADDATYTETVPSIVYGTEESEGFYRDYYYQKVLPDGIKYVRFQLGANANGTAGRIDTVNIEYKDVRSRQLVDETEDFSRIFYHTDNVDIQGWGYDDTPKYVNLESDDPCYLVYRSPSGDFTGFELDAFVNRWAVSQLPGGEAFEFYVSRDNVNYEKIETVTVQPDQNGEMTNNFYNDKYIGQNLPAGSRYLKVRIMSDAEQSWGVQIGTVALEYKLVKSTFTDEAEDFSKVYSASDNISVQGWGYDDSSKFVNSGSDDPCYVVYKSLEGDVLGFEADGFVNRWAVSQLPGEEAFEFYVSADNETYEKITPEEVLDPKGEMTNNFYNDKYRVTTLPAGVRYLKVMLMSNAEQAWGVQLGALKFDYEVRETSFIDETEDFSKLSGYSGNVSIQGWGYDATLKYVNVGSDEECFLIYETPSGDFTAVTLDAFVNRWAVSQLPGGVPFRIFVSGDNISYQEVIPNVTPDPKEEMTNNFYNDKYEKKDLPDGTRYVKIRIMSDAANAWGVQIGTVILDHKAANRPPVADPRFTMATYRNEEKTIAIPATDPDGDTLSYTLKTEPQHGTAEINGGSVTYIPDADFIGDDRFTVEAFDGADGKADQNIAVVVSHPATNINYYVSSVTGSDDNDGLTPETPFKTIQKAADLTLPGDTVHIMNGTYGEAGKTALYITRSGTADAYITYRAYEGHKPKIVCIDTWDNILVEGADYIKIEGLTVEGNSNSITYQEAFARYEHYKANSPGGTVDWGYLAPTNANGIFIRDRRATDDTPADYSHHVEVRSCEVYLFPGAGIGTDNADYITIENNRVYSNAWWSIYANSGITLFHSQDWDSNTTTYKNVIRNNICYDNESYILWMAHDRISDGNGIIIDDNKHSQSTGIPPYEGRTLVANNVVYENGGGGINCYSNSNVDIIGNTAYNNSRSPDLTYAQIMTGESSNCRIFNNIIYTRNGEAPTSNGGGSNNSFDYNLYFNGITSTPGAHDVYADPLFVNISGTDLSAYDFRLREGSPAIDAGTEELAPAFDVNGGIRPLGQGFDIGAYEFDPDNPPVPGEEPRPMSVGTVTFTDYAGNAVTGLTPSGFVRAAASVTNNGGTGLPAVFIVALYDSNHAVKSLSLAERTLGAEETVELSAGFNLPENIEGCYIKVLVWNSMDIENGGMQPLSNQVIFPQ